MIDKSSNHEQDNNTGRLLDSINELIQYQDGKASVHERFKCLVDKLEQVSESGITAGFPALIDIIALIKESADKCETPEAKVNLLDYIPHKILPNLTSYINKPESGSVKDTLIMSLRELDSDYTDNRQIDLLRDMLDIFYDYSAGNDNNITNNAAVDVQTTHDDQLQQYKVNKNLPNDICEILEIMMTEYLSINHAINNLLENLNNGDTELLNNGLDEIQLSFKYYSDAVLSMGYEGLSIILNHIIVNINKVITMERDDIKNLLITLGNYANVIMQYLQDPYEDENKKSIIDSVKNLHLPFKMKRNEITKFGQLIKSLNCQNDKNNESGKSEQKITSDDVSLQIQDDTDQDLLDALLNELPVQIEELSNSIQNIFENYNADHILVAKRIAHTLKGSANTVGIRGIASMTHHLEDILLGISKRNTQPDDKEKNVILNILDCLCEMSDAVLGSGPVPTDAINILQQAFDIVHQIQTNDVKDVNIGNISQMNIDNQVDENIKNENKTSDQVSMVRVPGNFIDYLLRMSGESMIFSRRLQNQVFNIKNQLDETRKYFDLLNNLNSRLEKIVDIKDLANNRKTSINRLNYDSLEMDNYSELHICSKHLVEVSSDIDVMSKQIRNQLDNLNNTILKQLQVNNEAQEIIFKARLVPASTIATRLQRCVRQAAKLTNKDVKLKITGGETLIDGEILNELLEPLSHILRNAVDHGIEDTVIRTNNAKSSTGNIEIHFEVDGNNISIKCMDDGMGLDYDSIRNKAVNEGILSDKQSCTDEELAELIFKPGFTTKTDSTHISGRGIGMDAVYSAINKLSGTININSKKNAGTTIDIKLPQNLQKIYGLVVSAGQDNIVLANREINQIIYNENVKNIEEKNKHYIVYNKNRYPARYLESLLYIDAERREKPRFTTSSILYNTGNETIAVIVQKIVSSNYFIVKNLSDYIPKLTGILGVTILDNGKVTPVIDLVQLINKPLPENKKTKRSLKYKKTTLPKAVVVDDSLTARKSLVQFMEDSGFQVRAARDGVEALDIIRFYNPDIVITDLEMPEMTGLELTSHIRSTDSISSLPVIMITSRALEKHKDEAINSGVNAYIIKPYSETQLIEIIRDIFKAKNHTVHN